MFGHEKREVLVVGAGPTGLLAALALAEADVKVMVIDEAPRAAGHSYALALHPASVSRLEELGLGAELRAAGRAVSTLAIYEGADRRLAIPIGDGRHPALALPQNALEKLLVDRLSKRHVKVHWNHRLARMTPGKNGVQAVVHRLERESCGYAVARTDWVIDKEILCDVAYVVGADGHGSLVRRILEIPFEEIGASQVFAVFECVSRNGPVDEVRLVLSGSTVNALWPLPGGRVRWSLELTGAAEVSAEERFKSRLIAQVGERFFHHLEDEEVRALVHERAPWFKFDSDAIGWSIEVRFERRLAASFGRDRVWLAGDAAHLTGPVGMQSMNAGLREAADLAEHLATNLREGAGSEFLEAYGRDRLAEWRFLLGKSGRLETARETPAFVSENADRLLACLPGTDGGFNALAAPIGLRPVRA
jgi:3-(3-hydroxy-phenyl)propionate hydroxylase